MNMAMCSKNKPLLVLISAPSGTGKSTLCARLLESCTDIVYSVSCTTRAPRGDEVHGRNYFFMAPEAFELRVRTGDFLEHAEVHGNRYGTLKETVRKAMGQGQSILMDIDVQGACQVRSALAELPQDDEMAAGFVDIFVLPPSMEALRERLTRRAEDTAEVIEKRLRNAVLELEEAGAYRYQVVNDDLNETLNALLEIIGKEQCQ